ncbi:MAG: threonine synthase [Actinobacteria bacterium]|nr:threonine synthase [Actinomycetota bacterium]
MSFVTRLSCPGCGPTYDRRDVHNLCGSRSSTLVDYDLVAIDAGVTKQDIAHRDPNMWRYREFLPVDGEEVVNLGEGFTPLMAINEPRRLDIDAELWIKDEGVNPTGSFKARGASCGISRAVELGIKHVGLPTAGNAGGAWACYGAAAGVGVHVVMPRDAPEINKLECALFGADLLLVDGLISDAGKVVARGVEEQGWFDASTLKEPYRIEGKKTIGLEIAEQLDWTLPDVIIYPAGGGVGAIGIDRAINQLLAMGWVKGTAPRMVIVQAEGCAPLVRAFDEGAMASEFWEGARTVASGLRVPKAIGDFLVLDAVRRTGGTAVAVSDEEILTAMGNLARVTGLLAAPEGAATVAAAQRLSAEGWIRPDERVVLINTGNGVKYPNEMRAAAARLL